MPRLPSHRLRGLPLAAAITDPVRVEQGSFWVSRLRSDVRVYKGVPFAAPPVGDLRWRRPSLRRLVWRSQGRSIFRDLHAGAVSGGSLYYSAPQPVSEDCLYLNIWTAAKAPSDKRPVMVWIHGGAFTAARFDAVYDGENLAKKGVVVVTVNYRSAFSDSSRIPSLLRNPSIAVRGLRHSR